MDFYLTLKVNSGIPLLIKKFCHNFIGKKLVHENELQKCDALITCVC